MSRIRRVKSPGDFGGYAHVWNAITPREPVSAAIVRSRWAKRPERLYLVAERDGRIVGNGFAGWSDTPGRAFLAVRVLPDRRRQGIGSELYEACAEHAGTIGAQFLSGHVSEADSEGLRFGFSPAT